MSKDAERKIEEAAKSAPGRSADQKADPELLRQMKESEDLAASRSEPDEVQAVFVLEYTGSGASASGLSVGSLPSPEDTERMVMRVVERVQAETGKKVELLNVFRYLNSFVVSGEPEAIRSLLEQPEIASAVANHQPGKVELLTEPGSSDS